MDSDRSEAVMIKNLSILILGIFIGVGGMYLVQLGKYYQAHDSMQRPPFDSVASPEVDYDQLYDQLIDEQKPKAEEGMHWFDEELETLQAEAEKIDAKRKAEGEDAANLFRQFSESGDKE